MMLPRGKLAWTDRSAVGLGLAGLCCAAVLQGWVTPSIREQTSAVERSLAAQEQAARDAAARSSSAATDRTAVDPLAHLPPASAQHTRLAGLAQTIGKAQIQGDAIDLATTADPTTGVVLSRVSQTAKGRYSDVRQALSMALEADPALALEDLRLSRPSVDQPDLQVQWTWVLLSRAPGGPKP